MGDKPIKVQEFRGVGEIDEPYCIAHIGGCTHCLTEAEASKLENALHAALQDFKPQEGPTEEELDAKYGEGVRPKYGALFTKKS